MLVPLKATVPLVCEKAAVVELLLQLPEMLQRPDGAVIVPELDCMVTFVDEALLENDLFPDPLKITL